MTEKEAIERLVFDIDMILFDPNTGETLTKEQVKIRNEDNYNTLLADEVAISALNLRIPRKPVDNPNAFGDTVTCCPRCGKTVINYWNRKIKPPHCMMCGQKLDWEE